MPELPEVETVMRGLTPVMAGARVLRVEQRRADLRFPLPKRLPERLTGRRIVRLSRRAKYILFHLDSDEVLIAHLGMTGRFTIGNSATAPFTRAAGGDPRHDHVVFHLTGGTVVTFNDARRFGYMDLLDEADLKTHKFFVDVGVEPLSDDFTAGYLAARAAGRKVDLKAFLLDQHVIAGVGNIYASEALFRAGLKPSRAASTLADAKRQPNFRAAALVDAVRGVLVEAIAAGGSSLRNYVQASGELGYFQKAHAVYDLAGEPCRRTGCGGTIKRRVQAGRATFYCPRCQR
jgi:formamidopyrimidine-DNA glycosylase